MQISLLDRAAKIGSMENKETLTGQLARLPDGQLVKVEVVHSDGLATVRRVDGEQRGRIAVCKVGSLRPVDGAV